MGAGTEAGPGEISKAKGNPQSPNKRENDRIEATEF